MVAADAGVKRVDDAEAWEAQTLETDMSKQSMDWLPIGFAWVMLGALMYVNSCSYLAPEQHTFYMYCIYSICSMSIHEFVTSMFCSSLLCVVSAPFTKYAGRRDRGCLASFPCAQFHLADLSVLLVNGKAKGERKAIDTHAGQERCRRSSDK